MQILISIAFFLMGLAETLSSTGLVIQISPDARWGPGVRTLALGGLLQMAASILLASGRKTRWALCVLLCYAGLGIIVLDLPPSITHDAGITSMAAIVCKLAAIGGLAYCLRRVSSQPSGEARRGTSYSND